MITLLHRLRYPLLAALAGLLVLLWPGVRAAAAVDNSLSIWLLEGDPAMRSYHAFQRLFGNDELVMVVVRDSAHTLLTADNQRRLLALSEALAARPGVRGVLGPASARPAPGASLDANLPLLAAGLDSAALRRALAGQPTLRGQVFSPDFRTARLVLSMQPSADYEVRRGAIVADLRQTVGHYFVAGRAAWLGGVGVLYVRLNELSQRDFGFFMGLGYLLMFGVLLVLYRRAVWLLYALGIVGLATYLTLGVYGALGFRLNLLTVLLPVVIILLGLMDALHVLNEVQQLAARPEHFADAPTPAVRQRRLALHALREMLFPCAATMLTNIAGFLALLSSPMAILRSFGVFAALGIACCLVLTFLLGVWLLPLAGATPIKNSKCRIKNSRLPETEADPATGPRPTGSGSPIFNSPFLIFNSPQGGNLSTRTGTALARLYSWVLSRRRVLSYLSLAVVLALAAGLPRLRADTYTLGYLPPHDPVVREHQAIGRYWGAYMPLELLVRARPGQTLASPAVQRATQALADSLGRLPGVGRVFGFQSLYRAGLESRLGPGRRTEAALASPAALRLSRQGLQAAYPDLLRQFEDSAGTTGRLTVAGDMLSARQLAAKMAVVRRLAGRVLGPLATVEPAGYQPLYAAITQYVTSSQISSLLWSFGVVLGLVWLLLGSWRLALLTVLPNLFPVLVVLGCMGWAGVRLDIATASIASIVLSLSVDDTVHFVHHYRRQRRHLGPAAARLETIRHVGPAIVLTGAILFCGYAFMALGELRTVRLFGLLTAVSIVGALFGELLIFPLLLARFDPETRQDGLSG